MLSTFPHTPTGSVLVCCAPHVLPTPNKRPLRGYGIFLMGAAWRAGRAGKRARAAAPQEHGRGQGPLSNVTAAAAAGDQNIFVRKADFQAEGGYDEQLCIMEDADLTMRLHRRGTFLRPGKVRPPPPPYSPTFPHLPAPVFESVSSKTAHDGTRRSLTEEQRTSVRPQRHA